MKECAEYLLANLPDRGRRNAQYWLFATIAMHNRLGDSEWITWNREMRKVLVETQTRDGCAAGSWDPAEPTPDVSGQRDGRLMTTCLSVLSLEVYYRYLPLNKPETKETGGPTDGALHKNPVSKPSQPLATTPAEPPPALLTAFGKVVDPAGKPVAGATVHLREWSTYRISQDPYNENLNDILATTQTDAEGAFQFKNVPARALHDEWLSQIPWDVVVVAKPYAIAWRHLDAAQQSKPLKIALAPEAKITGQVKDKQGRPIQNAEVRAISISSLTSESHPPFTDPETLDLAFSRLAPIAKTDADGKVTVAGLPRELLFTFVVTHDDFRREIVRVATTDQPQADIDVPSRGIEGKMPSMEPAKVYAGAFSIALRPPLPRIVGRVLAADSKKPLAQTRVDLYGGLGTMTDEDGRFTIREIPDQPCRLFVSAPKGYKYLGR